MKRGVTLMSFLIVLSLSIAHADSLILEEITVAPGDTASINLILNNSVAVGGFQFIVTPSPAGEVTFSEAVAVNRAGGWIVSTNLKEVDSLVVIGYSASGTNIDAGNEALLTLKYLVTQDASVGTIALELSGVLVLDDALQPVSDITVENGGIVVEGNLPPVATFSGLPVAGNPPLEVNLDAGASSDADGEIAGYSWILGDGTTSTGQKVNHTYDMVGSYTVTLTVTDTEGATGTYSRSVEVYEPGTYKRGDVNRDGKTDIFDLLTLLAILGGSAEDYY